MQTWRLRGRSPWMVYYLSKERWIRRKSRRSGIAFKTVAKIGVWKYIKQLIVLEPGKMLQRLHEGDGLSCGKNVRRKTVQSENVFIFKPTGTKIGVHDPPGCFQRGFTRCLEMPNRWRVRGRYLNARLQNNLNMANNAISFCLIGRKIIDPFMRTANLQIFSRKYAAANSNHSMITICL